MIDVTGQLIKLIDVTGLQRVQDELARGTGLAMLLVDYLGNPVTKHSCCSAFCHEARNDERFSGLCKKAILEEVSKPPDCINRSCILATWA